ncbi:uncharacterized protein LOC110720251 [Chenopodium quinoa]|uniref:uncharacterized protein LOC110720251 n=1 Tax=Chenopodium quinoa TaxID=63459 RepID=UPI000B773737|nr:uncharacterized protein LOC110720251 [Chenopodium quinoa]
MLQDLCQQCRTKQLSFEVVLVHLPFFGCLDPKVCIWNFDNMLKQHNLSCWRLPFRNSLSCRLNRLMGIPFGDKLIVVGPHHAFVEPYGGNIFRALGINAYPFSREGLVQRQLDKVKEHTLESLLVHGSRNHVLHGDTKIAVSELLGKNILVYYDSLAGHKLFYQVLTWYHEIKANNPDFEVVFVRENSTAVREVESDLLASMPWLVCPFDLTPFTQLSSRRHRVSQTPCRVWKGWPDLFITS